MPSVHKFNLAQLRFAGAVQLGKALSLSSVGAPSQDVAMVESAPVLAGLIVQMGLEARHVVRPLDDPLLYTSQPGFNVFHVENAAGSGYLPAQQTFVAPYGIRKVVGMGCLMPNGELFAVILFSCIHIPREVATLFRTLALSVKLAFLPFAPNRVFCESPVKYELRA